MSPNVYILISNVYIRACEAIILQIPFSNQNAQNGDL